MIVKMLKLKVVALLALVLPMPTHADITLMTIGDSITSGFPHNDGISGFQEPLGAALNVPVMYLGDQTNPETGTAIVGGDGYVIKRQTAVFSTPGADRALSDALPALTESPDWVVVLVGVNDFMRLIAPSSGNSFTPSIEGDYTSTGTFSLNGSPIAVDSMIDRYAGF